MCKLVAYLEASYFAVAMMPPSLVTPVTGWNLTADGHWIVKIVGMALGTQAHTAWSMRNKPNVEVAKGLAFYQLASATVDWVMWLVLKDEGIFQTPQAQALVVCAFVSHYLLGGLMIISIRNHMESSDDKKA